jgi:hypothetical protein
VLRYIVDGVGCSCTADREAAFASYGALASGIYPFDSISRYHLSRPKL